MDQNSFQNRFKIVFLLLVKFSPLWLLEGIHHGLWERGMSWLTIAVSKVCGSLSLYSPPYKLWAPLLLPGLSSYLWSFPSDSDNKESACKVGDLSWIPGSGRSAGEGNGNPLQYPCLENSMDRGAWQATGSQRVGHDWGTNHFTFKKFLLWRRKQNCVLSSRLGPKRGEEAGELAS